MIHAKKLVALFFLLTASLLYGANSANADTPDITGQWYGLGTVNELGGASGDFSMNLVNTSDGLLAVMYVPEFGLFDQPLPVTITDTLDGPVVTIGIAGLLEFSGLLAGNRLEGTYYAHFDGDPPFSYTGTWNAEKLRVENMVLGPAPGPPCNNLPPLYCVGDVAYCSELVLFEPALGDGYADYPANYPETEEDQVYSYIRRDLMMLIKYATAKVACKTADWGYGNFEPLALGDMSEADGSTPALLTLGSPAHPLGTHEDGRDIDTAYYQVGFSDNRLRAICRHHDWYMDAYHCTETPFALDVWRTALYLAYLAEHPHLRVVGVDGQAGLLLDNALDTLVAESWIDADLRAAIPLAYELEDTGLYWFRFHHHHNHISMNDVYDAVSSVDINPSTLNRDSKGKFVTVNLELVDHVEASRVTPSSIALTLDGHTRIYARPEQVTLSDYNSNGIVDLTIKFDRQEIAELIGRGEVEIAVTGLIDDYYIFQTSDTVFVLGDPPQRGLRSRTQSDTELWPPRKP